MQKELQDLQPRLIQTSKETEELIIIIEKETVEAAQVKNVVAKDEAVANKAAQAAQEIKVRDRESCHNLTWKIEKEIGDLLCLCEKNVLHVCLSIIANKYIWYQEN